MLSKNIDRYTRTNIQPEIPSFPVQFVELHSEPLLETLYVSFCRDYPHIASHVDETKRFKPPPSLGNLNLDAVKDSTYFFS